MHPPPPTTKPHTHMHTPTHTHPPTHPPFPSPYLQNLFFVVAPKLLMVNPRQILNPLHPPPPNPPPPRAPQAPPLLPSPINYERFQDTTGILYVSNLTDCQWYEENFGRRDFLSDRKLNAWRFDFNIERCIVTDFRVFEILSRFRWCV